MLTFSQILRFDDTNPNEEDQVYFDAIESIIKWLGTAVF